jgi:hypothetical protein
MGIVAQEQQTSKESGETRGPGRNCQKVMPVARAELHGGGSAAEQARRDKYKAQCNSRGRALANQTALKMMFSDAVRRYVDTLPADSRG